MIGKSDQSCRLAEACEILLPQAFCLASSPVEPGLGQAV